MKIRIDELRSLVRAELLREAAGSYPNLLDAVLQNLKGADDTLTQAFEAAPEGKPRAIIMGLHQDLFNTIASFRGYVRQLKSASMKG